MNKNLLTGLVIASFSYTGWTQSTDSLQNQMAFNHYKSTDTLALVAETLPQEDAVYRLKPAIDIPVTAVSTAWTLYGFTQIYSKDDTPESIIQNIKKEDVNSFDRWAAGYNSEKAADISDLIFYGSMPLPAVLFLDKEIRKDAGKVGFLYLESMALTGLLYTGSAYLYDRFRPYVYNETTPMGDRLEGNAKNSFFAGHVALVATSGFFIAKIYSDYHPGSSFNKVLFGLAGAATATTGYLRLKGGRHFPSDVLLGAAVGTLSGILVPHFHKNKSLNKSRFSITPFTGRSHGLSVSYKLP